MSRMTQMHIAYLEEIIAEGSKFSDEAVKELAEIKKELAQNGIVVI